MRTRPSVFPFRRTTMWAGLGFHSDAPLRLNTPLTYQFTFIFFPALNLNISDLLYFILFYFFNNSWTEHFVYTKTERFKDRVAS